MKRTFGIIGCGSIAQVHAQAIRNIEQAELGWAASRTESQAKAFAEEHGCKWTTDYRELLQQPEIDVVCVTTGSGSHYKIGVDVLEAGKHLVMEKPVAMTSQEADELIRLAAAKGLMLSVVSQTRFAPHHQAVYHAIRDGKLGKLLLVEVHRPFYRTQEYYDSAPWRGTLAEDGGALMNQGIHSLDLLLWIAGLPQTVIGRTGTMTHRMEAEDMGLALLTLENGAFATIMCSTSIVPGFTPSMHFYGEKGSIKIEGSRIAHWTVPGEPEPTFEGQQVSVGGVSDPKVISTDLHRWQLLDVIEAIETGRRPLVTGEDGRNAVKLVELITRSSASNGVSLPY